jgi:filamentous hemagglutinin family protein
MANAPIFGLTLGVLIGFAGAASAAPALPTGGQVAAGSASIAKSSASTVTIDQISSRAIIDWSSFSIGQGGAVQFDNGSGATLNRVTGGSLSSIDGLLSATGSVYLINPNGVIIGKDGVVDTGGTFVASTQDLTNASFMTGGTLTFAGNSTASVLNLGKVGSLGGDVALIASKVENDGSITASQGDVGLAAGFQVVMSDATQNDGKFQVLVGGSGTSATNTGSIQAAEAELRANGGNVYALAGNTGGIIEATGVSSNDGKVLLIAENGTTTISGTISAQGANGTGGQVETSGETLDLGAAKVDTHGGSWLLDPTNLIVDATAAGAIDVALVSGNVTLATSASGAPTGPAGSTGNTASGAGDIIIESALSWATTSTLTLDAYHSIAIEAPITVTGVGQVVLNTNYGGGSGGDYGFGLTAAGFLGSLSFANTSSALTINGTSYTLEANPAALVTAIDADTSGDFALAASGSLGVSAGAFIPAFSGDFTGLGHTITGLTIDDTSANGFDGLFGYQTAGTIRDIGLAGGSVAAPDGADVGDLVGYQPGGSITDAYATGAVSGNESIGGLVGLAAGSISNAYATGAVSGTGNFHGGLVGSQVRGSITDVYATGAVSGSDQAGGLVGVAGGTISDAYATGAVSGGLAGGLAGEQAGGSIADVYATGAVSGSGAVGGLVGERVSGTVTDGYYDAGTTGQALGAQADGSVGMTAAALQGALPTLQNSSLWSTGPGLYPYLTNFYPSGVQAITGYAYSDGGVTPAAGTSVSAIAGGAAFGSASVGANGYYYIFAAAGGVSSGQNLLTYDATTNSATLTTATGATAESGGVLYGSAMTVPTTALLLSTAPILTEAQASGISADGAIAAAATVIGDTTALGLVASGAGFTIDAAPTTSLVVKTTAGNITVAAPFTLAGSNYLTLDSYQGVAIDAPITVSGAGAVNLITNDGGSGGGYSFDLTGSSFAGGLSFTSEGSDPSLVINGQAYTLVYSMSELATIASSGDYALATSLAGGSQTGAVVGTFGGTFTGLGNEISGLTITGSSNDVGLFGTLDGGGEIRDLGLVGGTVSGGVGVGALVGNDEGQVLNAYSTAAVSGSSDVGGLVGYQASIGVISNAATSGASISGTSGVGGLVGKNSGTIESDSSSSDAVSGNGYVGGLAGYTTGAITGASATGAVTGTGSGQADIGGLAGYNSGNISGASAGTGNISGIAYVGGLVGYNAATGTLSDDATSGASVSGTNVIGGLAGENLGTIESASSSSDAVSGSRYVGGLAGLTSGAITDASATGAVTGTGGDPVELGGLAGYNSGNISGASAGTGNVSGTAYVGGLVGYNLGTIENGSSSSNPVSGTRDVGGLAGYSSGTIENAAASGTVTGTGSAPEGLGGLVGENGAAGEITTSQATGRRVNAPGGIDLGGLVGTNEGQISQSFATQSVGSDGTGEHLGGLVGYNTAGAAITDTYALGEVEAGTYIGGLVGDNAGSVQTSWTAASVASGATSGGVAGANMTGGALTNVFWDIGDTGLASAIGNVNLGSSTNVIGVGGATGENPEKQSTYTGFNFTTVWTILPGISRPYLRNVAPSN